MNQNTKDLIEEVYELTIDFDNVSHKKEMSESQKVIAKKIMDLAEILYYESEAE